MLFAVMVGCEIGFWVLVAGGLTCRYLLRWRRVSAALLLCVPLLDVALLTVTVVDLAGGGTANVSHGLAAVYLGFTVTFGHSMIRWADQRFAHRFAGGPPPVKPPARGWGRTRYEWREWAKALGGAAIAAVLLLGMVAIVGDEGRTAALLDWIPKLGTILGIWLIIPVACTIWPGREKRE